MLDERPIIAWLRRDLRLSDHPMLAEAAATGRPVIPVFLCDEVFEATGAAPRWRLGLGVGHFARSLGRIGSRLILRRGRAAAELARLVRETGAGSVWWTRAYDPPARARDAEVAEALDVETRAHGGHLLFEPWTVETGAGGYYKVFTPYWRTVRERDVSAPVTTVRALRPPDNWPASDSLERWEIGSGMDRGAAVVEPHLTIGEDAATDRLEAFIGEAVAGYDRARDVPAAAGTSGLSENLTYGEISVRACWHAGRRAEEEGKAGASTWLKELVWREFAHHLLWHTPRLATENWRREWNAFPWRGENEGAELWRRGRTGIPFVDAAMREMFVTGRMHNRARMITASYLTKHLLTHWRIGCDWFSECLVDWDPANNALGWQWSAGSGPDATPYFRVFNPLTQAEKFDPDGCYVGRWIAEGQARPGAEALSFFEAVPRSWGMSPHDPYPDPVVTHEAGRQRALDAYREREF